MQEERVENIEYFNLNKLISFYAQDSEFKLRVKKLSGILQYREVSLNEIKSLTQEYYEEIFGLLKEYEEKKLVVIDGDKMTYTLDGIFWGNSITAAVVEKMINIGKES